MAQAHPIANTEPKETSFDRRAFLKSTAIGAAGLGTMTSMLGRVPQASAEEAQSSSPEAPGTEMTLEELNAFRKDLVDKQTDYTCADGTVIPAVYVKLRALINSYSFGFGSEVHDHCFDEFIYLFTEDEAQAYLEMPYGVEFTATDFAVSSGRSEEECRALCEDLASRAVLRRVRRGGVPYYHHVAMAYGLWEYRVCGDDSDEYAAAHSAVWGEDAPDNSKR